MKNHSQRQDGTSLIELLIALPVVLTVGLGTVQGGLLLHAKSVLNYSTFEAARKGAVNHADPDVMKTELGLRLAPVLGGEGDAVTAAVTMARSVAESKTMPFTRLEIISPTREAFEEWSQHNVANDHLEIPNSHLLHRRHSVGSSGVNIQDANLLKIRTTAGIELKVPLVNSLFSSIMTRVDPANSAYYEANRIPVSAHAVVRMQSPVRLSDAIKPAPGGMGSVPLTSAPSSVPYSPLDTVATCDENGLRTDIDAEALDSLLVSYRGEQCVADTTAGSNADSTPTHSRQDALALLTDCE